MLSGYYELLSHDRDSSVTAPGLGVNLLTETLVNFAFLGALAACFYSIIQTVLGRYAEIPTISEAASSQIR